MRSAWVGQVGCSPALKGIWRTGIASGEGGRERNQGWNESRSDRLDGVWSAGGL